jgi:hypothetical protein
MEHRSRVTILPTRTAPAGSFEEERLEVLDSVFQAMCRHAPDADEMAACAYLVRHLAQLEPAP